MKILPTRACLKLLGGWGGHVSLYLPEKLKADGAIYPQKAFEVSHEVLGFGFQQEVSRRRQPGPGWGSLDPEGFIISS